MSNLLGLILVSFVVTGVLMLPFIDALFWLKRKFEKKNLDMTEVNVDLPIHNKIMKHDIGTPSGGGVLLITVLLALSTFIYSFFITPDYRIIQILQITLVMFGSLGFMDDIKWLITKRKGKILGLDRKIIFLIQLIFASVIGAMLYYWIGLNNIYITGLGNFVIGAWYIPVAIFVIVAFTNAYNITDGLDGLSTGLLAICLFALLVLAAASLDKTLATFVGIWLGTLFAFLYFNVYPARIFLGDAGAFAFGATLAVVGLLTGKILALAVIGGIYVLIAGSSLMQILSKKLFDRRVFTVAPVHMYFRYIGWEEPKVVARFWLAGAICAIFGLWIGLVSK